MPRLFTHFIFILFTLTVLSGIWIRLTPFQPMNAIPYTNLISGHSHMAILGWAFVGVLAIFLSLFWKSIKRRKEAMGLMVSLFTISILMFVAYIYQGYGGYSTILSTIHIIAEYWAAWLIFRETKNQSSLPKISRLFINGSLIALVISSFGLLSLGAIAANGLKDSSVFDTFIFFYLHFHYNGWLYLMLIGLFISILQTRRIPFREGMLKFSFWCYFIALFPGYYLSILWIQPGTYSNILATIGGLGQWVGVFCIIIAFREIWVLLYEKFHEITIISLWITFFILMVKSTMQLGLIAPVIADLVYQTKSIINGYLQFTLLGFVSIFILIQLQFNRVLQTNSKQSQSGFIIFLTGFFINELFLFGDGLAKWSGFNGLPYLTHGLLFASILLLIGILMIWISSTRKNTQAPG